MNLKKSMEASTYQLKNLSYNIQGYLDDVPAIGDASLDRSSSSKIDIALPKLKKFKEKGI